MKKVLFFFLMLPLVASANPYMGDCKTQYNDAYNVMMLRQSGTPMFKLIDSIEALPPEGNDILTNSELTEFYKAKEESIKIIERAYTMPNLGFMESAAHTMAAEFANRQYILCTRAKRK